MKLKCILVSVICAVASVSAGIIPQHYSQGVQLYQHEPLVQNVYYDQGPVIHNGVPEDTPEVQAAKAAHFIAYAKAEALAAQQPSDGQYHEANHHYQQPLVTYSSAALYNHQDQHYRGKRSLYQADFPILAQEYHHEEAYHVPLLKADGTPIDTPEVALAREQHLLAHHLAKSGEAVHAINGGASSYVPVIGPHGVPYDTPEVQIAKAQHLVAHAEASTKDNQWALHSGYGSEYDHYY